MTAAAKGQRLELIPEGPARPGQSLGRHIHFDERSRAYRVPVDDATPIESRIWKRRVQAFAQGPLKSCTGNAVAGLLCTVPFHQKGLRCNETLARKIYCEATRKDHQLGVWPPHDTGSTALAALKALRTMGLIKEYRWGFGLQDVLKTLSTIGPVVVGVHWDRGFDDPDPKGFVQLKGGRSRGGHCFEVLGVDVPNERVWAINSWGPGWGLSGLFCFSWKNLDHMLKHNGEAATIVI
jgi:hypothetical protein